MSMKENMLTMPIWKAAVCTLLLLFSFGVVIEEILAHTVFRFFDRMIVRMENDKKDDIADMDDMDKHEQADFCDKYKRLLDEKTDLAKRNPSEFSYDFAYNTMKEHERDIKFAIHQHYLNLALCQKTITRKIS
jgi:hypothetical protein